MNIENNNLSMEEALTGLLVKYSVKEPEDFTLSKENDSSKLKFLPGYELMDSELSEGDIPLLTWRLKRKFTELKKIVDGNTIENVRMLRFSNVGDGTGLNFASLLYREMDLCEFIGNGKIVSVKGVKDGDNSGNTILKLDNGVICSVEISTRLSAGSELTDRHEIIAQRGVASDVVVDTMIPQSSIYTYTENGESKYRDTDMELFGFAEEEIDQVRSAFQVLKQPELVQQWQSQHKRLVEFVNAAILSDKEETKIVIKN